MKKLFILIGLALTALSVRSQTTNITLTGTITITGPGASTNQFTINGNSRISQGLNLAWERDIMVANQNTNSPPTFTQSVRSEIISLLEPLQTRAIADELQKQRIAEGASKIAAIWPQMTAQEQSQLKALLDKYNP